MAILTGNLLQVFVTDLMIGITFMACVWQQGNRHALSNSIASGLANMMDKPHDSFMAVTITVNCLVHTTKLSSHGCQILPPAPVLVLITTQSTAIISGIIHTVQLAGAEEQHHQLELLKL